MVLQALNIETDLPALAELQTQVTGEAVTAAMLRADERKRRPDCLARRMTARDARGDLSGYGSVQRNVWDTAGKFFLTLQVAPLARRQGIGAALYDDLTGFLAMQEAQTVEARVRDNDPDSLRFATSRDFQRHTHIFESALDVAAFDETPFRNVLERAEAGGIRIFSFAETEGNEAAQRRLWEVNTWASQGQPGYTPETARPFEPFAKDVFGGYWFRPDGQILAADGERWIGLAAVGETQPGEWVNMVTCVYPEYRGRGIAAALKLQAIRACRRHNARTLRTNNHSANAPMLAINRKLGYQPEPGYSILQKIW